MTEGRLEGKVCIVTGAARGTGAETARLFAQEGADVVLADVAKAEGDGLYVQTDVTKEGDWDALVATTLEEFGRVDVLVNNAAVLLLRSIVDTTVEEYERVFRVNELGTFLGIRAVIPAMRSGEGGSIVNVSSIDGVFATPGSAAYAGSKFAVRGLTKTAALELGRFNIRVNAVCPNAGNIDMVVDSLPQSLGRDTVKGWIDAVDRSLPIGRGGTLRDIANAILFLASDDSAFFTGADLVPDGGLTAGMIVRGGPGT
ncbi:MAG: 3alpha(or 20beta)-hydroxysteroid dehydrogenase [Actinomycetota bacterium]|jgi:3alpha(or 20beta)-hydroxysteroid dehydrogenase